MPPKPPSQPHDDDLPPAFGQVAHDGQHAAYAPREPLCRPCLTISALCLSAFLLGNSGCVSSPPTMTAKASVSVKEVSAYVRVDGGAGKPGGNDSGELAANVSFEMNWGAGQ